MAMKQNDAEFFRPLWRRIAVTALVAGWFAYETLLSQDGLWIAVTSFALLYCVWNFFLRFPQEPPNDTPTDPPPQP